MTTFLIIVLALFSANMIFLGLSILDSRQNSKSISSSHADRIKGRIYPLERLETELKKAV